MSRAIELVSVCVRALSPAEMVDNLDDCFHLLTWQRLHGGGPSTHSVGFGGLVPCAVDQAGTGCVPLGGSVWTVSSWVLRKPSRLW
ncbi:hypothetical protein DIJ64_06735 [Mycobacterium leprae]|uniref:Uncharacterized protein n=1 Tax=Mycobacterium leprae TaxID=1769 RepID=A0AAD0P7T4_MYCLR|nr:hypothetical protein DIJ64_06735 [Mycobacterium leprae]OAR20541.1 hypothetical protein A8144_10505 [Mycobacterium leprae 3125609]OAX70757.1 hypothetical protein A3216_10140 [Mycobacterium leprae 7935681]